MVNASEGDAQVKETIAVATGSAHIGISFTDGPDVGRQITNMK